MTENPGLQLKRFYDEVAKFDSLKHTVTGLHQAIAATQEPALLKLGVTLHNYLASEQQEWEANASLWGGRLIEVRHKPEFAALHQEALTGFREKMGEVCEEVRHHLDVIGQRCQSHAVAISCAQTRAKMDSLRWSGRDDV